VSGTAVAKVPSLFLSDNGRLPHAVQQPYFFVVRIGAADAVKHPRNIIPGCVGHFSSEVLQFRSLIGMCSVAARVVIRPRPIVSRLHMSRSPEITCAFKIFAAADSVPIARRVHALASVVGSGPKVLGPE